MTDLPFSLPDLLPGQVWLVGAGPGDPGLITLLAAHALRQAEVVVYDALVDERLLSLAPHATHEPMGKRGGRASPKQPEINARLVALARDGKRVVRLKGGDPYVFGRGSDEALALAEAGIAFRVVPGVTAGVGGLAYAGIPATARDINSAVCFLTGHDAAGETPEDLDWAALARLPVLVFYMALRRLDIMSAQLIAAGRSPEEPVAVISRATTERQQVVETTLAQVAADVAAAGLQAPALLVIGEVVRLRRKLGWFG
jgi:uroporphyrin-III C-methyltransferase